MPSEELLKEDKMEDRRMFARINVRVPLKSLDLSSGKEGKGETVDISAEGVGIITNGSLSADTPIEMWLEIPDKLAPLHLQGKVAWSKALDNNNQRVGVSLEKQELIGLARVLQSKYVS
jgi:hypothetical protein